MKIIVSHDVDHLYWNDHLTDLFYPKLWIRETFAVLGRRISIKEWWKRICIPFHRNLNHLDEIMRFDKDNGIASTFFFGIANGLYMSYSREKALTAIRMVQREGFETGVHGIAYDDTIAIQLEHDAYHKLTGELPRGIRMHYVRYTDFTFKYLEKAGYFFDATEFDKQSGGIIKSPYPVGTMWEFPLSIMDGYLPYSITKAREISLSMLDQAEEQKIGYFSILFHDVHFSDAYSVYRDWYKWFVVECKKRNHTFVNYDMALLDLNNLCDKGNHL